ncbi:MAG: hypothetical protein ACLR8Y_10490 [Alistipes indistinctus]
MEVLEAAQKGRRHGPGDPGTGPGENGPATTLNVNQHEHEKMNNHSNHARCNAGKAQAQCGGDRPSNSGPRASIQQREPGSSETLGHGRTYAGQFCGDGKNL